MKIKDLKIGDIIKHKDMFHKILDKTDNLVAVSFCRLEEHSKENIKEYSLRYSCHFSEYDLKDFTLVIPEWKASELKYGDRYWYINCGLPYNSIGVDWAIWHNDKFDRFHLKSGNIYQTEKDAEKAYQEIMNKE